MSNPISIPKKLPHPYVPPGASSGLRARAESLRQLIDSIKDIRSTGELINQDTARKYSTVSSAYQRQIDLYRSRGY